MMRKIGQFGVSGAGVRRPGAGVFSPQLALVRVRFITLGVVFTALTLTAGCGSQAQEQNLELEQVGLTKDTLPIFDDGKTQLFEVKRGLPFPILDPDAQSAARLSQQVVAPYGRMPWVTNKDVKVQLTWTLSNLDDEPHVVELLIDPWNEFGRYYPGMLLVNAQDQKFEPNSSGIDHYYVVEGKGAGAASRRHGTWTFDDMNELAIDFATVQAVIDLQRKGALPLPNGVPSDPTMMVDPAPTYANHVFNLINHSYNDLLTAPYIPAVVAGLTGIDFGFRTTEKATVALDIQIEIVDLGQDRVRASGSQKALLAAPTMVVTVGSPVPSAM